MKIGKLKIFMLMKSLTPHQTNLSIKFPTVPAINNAAVNRFIFLFINNRINAQIPIILINMIKINGKGNDREMPVLNVGRINSVSFRYLRL